MGTEQRLHQQPPGRVPMRVASGDEFARLAARPQPQRQTGDHAVLADIVSHVVRHQGHEVAVVAQQRERGQRGRGLDELRREEQVFLKNSRSKVRRIGICALPLGENT